MEECGKKDRNSMKIGVDVRSLLEGRMSGVGEYTFRILKTLLNEDSKNQYIFFVNSHKNSREDFSWLFKYSNVELKHLRYPNKVLNFLLWYIHWPKIDRVLGGVDVFFAPNIQFLPLSRNVKFVLTLHDLSFELYPETFSWKRRLWHVFIAPKKLCRRANSIVTVSQSTADDALNQYAIHHDKITVVHNAVADSFQEVDRNSEHIIQVKEKYALPYKFILYLGTIEPRKNIISIIRAYNTLRKTGGKKYEKYKLVLAGKEGWKVGSIYQEIKESPYQEDIMVIGCVDTEDKPALYTLADVFVYPSLYEGFGFPVLEAMRCGTPVITSNTSSLAEIAGDAALLVDPLKPNEIYRCLTELLGDKQLYQHFSQKGKIHSLDFRWKKSARKILKTFELLEEQKK